MNELSMHWLDLTAVAFIGAAGLAGARVGLVRQLLRLTVLFLSISAAVAFCDRAAESLSRWSGEAVPRIAAVALTFVAVHVVLSLALMVARLLLRGLGPSSADEDDFDPAGNLLKALTPRKRAQAPAGLAWLNRLLGAPLAMGIATLVLGGGMLLADCVPTPDVHAELEGSRFHRGAAQTLAAILDAVPEKDREEFKAALERFRQRVIEKTGEKGGEAAHRAAGFLDSVPGPGDTERAGKTERFPHPEKKN